MAAALLVAALAGGGVAVAVSTLAGVGKGTTTVRELIREQGPGLSNVASEQGAKGLTLREIYKDDAPGVVQVTSTAKVQLPTSPFFGNPFGLPQSEIQRALG